MNWYKSEVAAQRRADHRVDPEQIAVRYAHWLAEKQGIELPERVEWVFTYTHNGLNGTKRGWAKEAIAYSDVEPWAPIYRRSRIRQELARIEIPHSDFDPSYTEAFSHWAPGLEPRISAWTTEGALA